MSGYEEYEFENPCTMCEEDEATTTWGAPVCADCAQWLTGLDVELQEMESKDPKLKRLGDKIND